MNKSPLLFFTALGIVGYLVFHGHQLGKDCLLCPYRGLVFMGSSVVLGIVVAYNEN